jgi:hypothetical protein
MKQISQFESANTEGTTRRRNPHHWKSPTAVAGFLAGLFLWPVVGSAQLLDDATETITGTTNGTTVVLADTGTLEAGTSDALQASDLTGGIPNLLTGEVLHAVAIGYSDQIDSEASLAALNLSIGGTSIGADFIMSRATASIADGTGAISNIDNLSINGVPVVVSGAPNQTIGIPGGMVVLNQQQTLSDGTMVVNALRAIVEGVADVAVASSMAGWSGGSAKAVQASY